MPNLRGLTKPFVAALLIQLSAVTGISAETLKKAVFAGGCFWCVEADFESVAGVKDAVSGFTGGKTENPTYKQVTKTDTSHYEAVEITYDAEQVSYRELLKLLFRSVDPTDASGQFCDRGDSYRTAVFYNSEEERVEADRAKRTARQQLDQSIATEILPLAEFYPADAYHQDYYKGEERVLTRFGWIKKKDAYKRYRKGCGRDQRVRQLWGNQAAFSK